VVVLFLRPVSPLAGRCVIKVKFEKREMSLVFFRSQLVCNVWREHWRRVYVRVRTDHAKSWNLKLFSRHGIRPMLGPGKSW